MCLIVVSWQQHQQYPLIVAANRDEAHARPSQALHWWADQRDVLGGRDLEAGGTWLALHRQGRFAAITNVREKPVAQQPKRKLRSRGLLVSEFVTSEQSAAQFVSSLDGERYAGFNVLLFDGTALYYYSNRDGEPRCLAPGLYGLSNALLNTPWEKVERSKQAVRQYVRSNDVGESDLLKMLADSKKAPVASIENDSRDFAMAHTISAPFIISPSYGTRCSTVVRCDQSHRWQIVERRFSASGESSGETRFAFDCANI